jgi:hypothetical protein
MDAGITDVAPGSFGRPVLHAKLGVTSDLQITKFTKRERFCMPFLHF